MIGALLAILNTQQKREKEQAEAPTHTTRVGVSCSAANFVGECVHRPSWCVCGGGSGGCGPRASCPPYNIDKIPDTNYTCIGGVLRNTGGYVRPGRNLCCWCPEHNSM